MTSLSQYLKAERLDPSGSVSFYVPGVESWDELRTPQGRVKLARRSTAQDETIYPVVQDDAIES